LPRLALNRHPLDLSLQVARITGVSYWCLLNELFLITEEIEHHFAHLLDSCISYSMNALPFFLPSLAVLSYWSVGVFALIY
jgi:hypothetical protein